MQRYTLLLPLLFLLACGQTSKEELQRAEDLDPEERDVRVTLDDDEYVDSPEYIEDLDERNEAEMGDPTTMAGENAGPESDVSGELPFEYMAAEDFRAVGDCSVMLKPEDNPGVYVLAFASPEGVAEATFDGTRRTLPFLRKEENANGTMTYTHGNDTYEAVTRINDGVQQSQEVVGVSGRVTIRRKSDGQAVTFKVIGEVDC